MHSGVFDNGVKSIRVTELVFRKAYESMKGKWKGGEREKCIRVISTDDIRKPYSGSGRVVLPG